MPKQVAYFDSQAAAAAALKVDVYEIRDAKTKGCTAFRSGRVYREELVAWLKKSRQRTAPPAAPRWANRRQLLFDIMDFLHESMLEGEITAAEFKQISKKTVDPIIALGEAWTADIDAKGYRRTIASIIESC